MVCETIYLSIPLPGTLYGYIICISDLRRIKSVPFVACFKLCIPFFFQDFIFDQSSNFQNVQHSQATFRSPAASVGFKFRFISQHSCALEAATGVMLAERQQSRSSCSKFCETTTPCLKVQALRSPQRRQAHTTVLWAFAASWKSARSCLEGPPDRGR